MCAGAGFLLAVLWFDLMFDVQVLRQPRGELRRAGARLDRRLLPPRDHRRARPMNRLVAAVMLATLGALIIAQIASGDAPAWVGMAVARARRGADRGGRRAARCPSAVRLGARADQPGRQSELARAICRQHLFCFGAIAALLVVQLAAG